ncbi:unnamed protein product, partial [Heterosigma akashiwo]
FFFAQGPASSWSVWPGCLAAPWLYHCHKSLLPSPGCLSKFGRAPAAWGPGCLTGSVEEAWAIFSIFDAHLDSNQLLQFHIFAANWTTWCSCQCSFPARKTADMLEIKRTASSDLKIAPEEEVFENIVLYRIAWDEFMNQRENFENI